MKKIISAKEQFESDVKTVGATYVDEVCGIDYYYDEHDTAVMYFACEENNLYGMMEVHKFEYMIRMNVIRVVEYLANTCRDRQEIGSLLDTPEGKLPEKQQLAWYCDFLFGCSKDIEVLSSNNYQDKEVETDTHVLLIDANNGDDKFLLEEYTETPYKVGEVTTLDEDWKVKAIYELPDKTQLCVVDKVVTPQVIGAECTDTNAISSMVEFLKSQLISKIEGAFDCIGEKKFKLERMKDRDMFNDLNAVDNDMWLEVILPDNKLEICFNYAHDDAEVDSYPLTDLLLEELLCIYSQLHK